MLPALSTAEPDTCCAGALGRDRLRRRARRDPRQRVGARERHGDVGLVPTRAVREPATDRRRDRRRRSCRCCTVTTCDVLDVAGVVDAEVRQRVDAARGERHGRCPRCWRHRRPRSTVGATPERLSVADSVTVTSVFVNDGGTADAVVTGGVRSIFTGALDAVVAFPARSSTVRDSCWATPSLLIDRVRRARRGVDTGKRVAARPVDRHRVVVPTRAVRRRRRARRQRRRRLVDVDTAHGRRARCCPRRRLRVPVTDWPAPSCSVVGAEHDHDAGERRRGTRSSRSRRCCSSRCRSAPVPPRRRSSGGVLSMRIVMSVVVVLPAWSVIVCARVVKPSLVTTWSAGHDVTPDRLSLHVQWTVTGPRVPAERGRWRRRRQRRAASGRC